VIKLSTIYKSIWNYLCFSEGWGRCYIHSFKLMHIVCTMHCAALGLCTTAPFRRSPQRCEADAPILIVARFFNYFCLVQHVCSSSERSGRLPLSAAAWLLAPYARFVTTASFLSKWRSRTVVSWTRILNLHWFGAFFHN